MLVLLFDSTNEIYDKDGDNLHMYFLMYIILLDADGVPDYNITYLTNKLALVVVFLLSDIDHLVFT